MKKVFIFLTLIILTLGGLSFVLYKRENNQSSKEEVDYKALREEKVIKFNNDFNQKIVSEEDDYGYNLMSDEIKDDERFDSLDKYKLWVDWMKENYPELGTENVNYTYGDVELYFIETGLDPEKVLSLELVENEDSFKIVEVYGFNKPVEVDGYKYIPECRKIFTELNSTGKNCASMGSGEEVVPEQSN